jgi:hypothetical protein
MTGGGRRSLGPMETPQKITTSDTAFLYAIIGHPLDLLDLELPPIRVEFYMILIKQQQKSLTAGNCNNYATAVM